MGRRNNNRPIKSKIENFNNMKFFANTLSVLSVVALIFSGCASTSTVDAPDSPETPSDVISFTLNAPTISTRADATHTLRYTARLFKQNDKSGEFEFLQKKQILEGSSTSTLVFEGVETGEYAIYIFADYVPAGTQALADGSYPDFYYDTTQTQEVSMRTFGPEIINNDHYDCFAKYITLTKNEEEVHSVISLPRVVAKVRVIEESVTDGRAASSISLTQFPIFTHYKIKNATPSEPYNYPLGNVTEGKWDLTPPPAGQNELFYFYTFAPYNRTETLSYLAFTVSADGLSDVNTNIQSGKIEVRQNYITTLKGSFIPLPQEDPGTRTDRILLDLSALTDWNPE